jgi:hypothetical protein
LPAEGAACSLCSGKPGPRLRCSIPSSIVCAGIIGPFRGSRDARNPLILIDKGKFAGFVCHVNASCFLSDTPT